MVRRLLTPRWLAIHLLTLVLVVACVLLGRWQLDRAADFHRSSGLRAGEVPVAIETVTAATGSLPGAAVGRLVTVTGSYDSAHAYLVPGHPRAGRPGFWVLDLVRLPGGAGVLVVRGWLPTDASPGGPVPPDLPTGQVTVTGRLQPSEDPGGAIEPGQARPDGQVAAANPVDLLTLVPYPLYDGYVTLVGQRPAADPSLALVPASVAGNDVPGFYFQHVAYVALWWLFAGFVVFFWWRLIRDEVRAPAAGAPADQAESDS